MKLAYVIFGALFAAYTMIVISNNPDRWFKVPGFLNQDHPPLFASGVYVMLLWFLWPVFFIAQLTYLLSRKLR
ncbi:hypothetical protein SAMN06296036_106191 [Pseudobacteriovorax antillogorgiicola]|uniref:Uncharacterized protein n=1 Tax=Pseudobacteriovorax antillogorgiicola TaxID=1513793 RepID=A0A1Y6BNB3_9BACT|nr:hypothetical protein EDD56_10652 [Pseudobacteriovorax antillogorgiicola]SMF18623.1 hypothetical protein SAMN06296036_106191 [Pseudobacteriovorax antillogorgiicola]